MALSYNSTNLQNQGKGFGKALKGLLILAVVFGSFGAGVVGTKAYAAYPVSKADKTCKSYLSMVLSGNLQGAYDASSKTMKAQKVADFKASLANLRSSNPKYQSSDVQILKTDTSRAVCVYVVDNLPPTTDGRTTGTLTIGLKDGKVDSFLAE